MENSTRQGNADVETNGVQKRTNITRRGFLRQGIVAGATAGALSPWISRGKDNNRSRRGDLTRGDAAILRFLAAAEIALAVESIAKATRSADSVATTGVCNVFPGAVNSIPSRAVVEIDVRDIDLPRRDGMLGAIRAACETVGAKRQVRVGVELINADAPAQASPLITKALSASCRALSIDSVPMVSRAYHDSLFMSRIAPTGMLFIPCRDGVSHRPDEYAAPEDIKRGVQVLASALAQLAQ